LHPNTHEIQYYLEGTGTIWLGTRKCRSSRANLVIIPKGQRMTHEDRRRSFQGDRNQDPPQADDIKLLN